MLSRARRGACEIVAGAALWRCPCRSVAGAAFCASGCEDAIAEVVAGAAAVAEVVAGAAFCASGCVFVWQG